MRVVGITGPMGAGKSHVMELLRLKGAVSMRADDASRELLATDQRLLALVREALGDSVFRPDGSLDRARTGERIFADAAARQALEAVLHPAMREWLRERLGRWQTTEKTPRLVALEAAILTHMGARGLVDCVVRVWSPPDICAARIAWRDGIALEEALRRLAVHTQLGLFDEPADYVLDTSGSLEDTGRRVDELWGWLTAPAPGPCPQ